MATESVPSSCEGSVAADHAEDYDVLDSTRVPKRNRFKFWSEVIGTKKRLRADKCHRRVTLSNTDKRTCPLCFYMNGDRKRRMQTTAYCSVCEESLCVRTFGSNRLSCYDMFHTSKRLVERERRCREPVCDE